MENNGISRLDYYGNLVFIFSLLISIEHESNPCSIKIETRHILQVFKNGIRIEPRKATKHHESAIIIIISNTHFSRTCYNKLLS